MSSKSKALKKVNGKMMKVVYGGPKPSDMFDPHIYGDRAMKRFTANKERKHKQWDKEGK